MATTYNNLYLDLRTELRRAGDEEATQSARELVCAAAAKTREELVRDGSLYASPEVEQSARELVKRHLAGVSHRRVGVLWSAARHFARGAHPAPRYRGAGDEAHRRGARRGELPQAVAAMKAHAGAYLLEVRVENEENVFPMVPAGAPVADIRLE